MEFIHTAIWVDDIDATRTFYCDILGLEETWGFTADDGVENVYIGTPDGSEIQFKHDPDGDTADPTGIDHLALGVEDTDDVFDRVVSETDCDVLEEPTTMDAIDRRVAFVRDPNGYVVEFVERV
ncbi:VOC family protein [Natronorubrum bangense]|uniref:VOC family protein n=2 Tax=Natronorubrum bangense TaxID=61858 RepID=A0A4D6HHN4_9EURY|nr:VOC family protein [Natronorubrum bangense]ELY44037.1 glyoxalase/bleomycin resistance protein/dioxygenase [Natronorubrum bangense JCM 10635]QCC53065.1 VOC family protein [Natronorubrum bangense]QCC56242.1 VOC family protein [Natronorubrum bangense]